MTSELTSQADRYMSIRETSEMLRIDYSTARRWLADGRLPSDLIAGRVFAIRVGIEAIALGLVGTTSIPEAARRTGLSERMINHLITSDKKLEAKKFMRRWYIFEESLAAYIKSRGEK